MSTNTLNDIVTIFLVWDREHQENLYDPVPTLTRLAELVEYEAEAYMKGDPDPFDERHPSRADPNCTFGQILKTIFRKDIFVHKLVHDYLRETYWSRQNVTDKDVRVLNAAACRLMVDILPGLESSAVFEPVNSSSIDSIVHRLANWAENASDPLQTYATALLASAMGVQDIANVTRDINGKLIPIMLDRLHALHAEVKASKVKELSSSEIDTTRPFSRFAVKDFTTYNDGGYRNAVQKEVNKVNSEINLKKRSRICLKMDRFNSNDGENKIKSAEKNNEIDEMPPVKLPCLYGINGNSNSSWAEMENLVFSNVQIYPPNITTKQVFILKYLSPMGEYQEFLSHIVEKNALHLVLELIDRRYWQNSRLVFEALRYLAAILCHKKFAIEFINMRGLEILLNIPRLGIAATGVSICLFYLSHCEDAMERICLLPSYVVSWLTSYALWLLECSHDSGRCHATMFFGLSFQFGVILKEFDAQDGLRRLFNVLAMLPILTSNDRRVSDDEECSTRQILRHVCNALKKYLEAHLYLKAETIHTAYYRDSGSGLVQAGVPEYKAYKFSSENLRENLNIVANYLCINSNWTPISELLELGGITLMLKIIALAYEWNYSGRAETVRSALDVISICAVMTKVQAQLCERIDIQDEYNTVGIQIILSAAENEIVADPEVQKAALNVLITCSCAPLYKEGEFVKLFKTNSRFVRKKFYRLSHSAEETIRKVWDCIRNNNGIMVLMGLIMIKTPITEADIIRALACQALAGLVRDDKVKQIISKLPFFTTGQLQSLMKAPILQEKRQEQVLFQKYSLELIERVSGKSTGPEMEASLTNIHRANVVAQTKIQFNEKQLLQIIYEHLLKHGLHGSANYLLREAKLIPMKTSTTGSLSPFTYTNKQSRLSFSQESKAKLTLSNNEGSTGVKSTPASSSSPATPPINGLPIKLPINKPKPDTSTNANKLFQKSVKFDSSHPQQERRISLDSIVTEYLTNQHALCKNPIVTCPPFDLLQPHKCPEFKPTKLLYSNFAVRHAKGIRMRRLDEHLIHSRFCPVKTFRVNDDDGYFSCCQYLNDRQLVVGTYNGDIKILNIHTNSEDNNFPCHESYIANIALSSDSRLMVTSSTWRKPLSALWGFKTDALDILSKFEDEEYFEFAHLSDRRLLGTRPDSAVIYDTETGKSILTLKPSKGNQYTKNRATMNLTDSLVLTDGVLFDVTSGKEIHKFDKLNQCLNGVFHPNGLEIIANTEVWDVRTYHLLNTVSALDQCNIIFPKTGRVMYALAVEKDLDDDIGYETSFKTLDAIDYSSIATIDVKKPIYNLACNRFDTQIALVENFGPFDNVEESTVKLYVVGRRKGENEDMDVDDDDDDDDNSDDGSGSDDSPSEASAFLELNQTSDSDDDDDEDDDEDDDDDDEDGDEQDEDMEAENNNVEDGILGFRNSRSLNALLENIIHGDDSSQDDDPDYSA